MGELQGGLMARFEGAGCGEMADNGRRRAGPARLTRLKVGDGPDSRVPPVSGRSERGGREAELGRRGDGAGPNGPLRAQEKKRKKGLPAWKLAG
jgi:hypothetical protein